MDDILEQVLDAEREKELLERLRDVERQKELFVTLGANPLFQLLREAADEVSRLREWLEVREVVYWKDDPRLWNIIGPTHIDELDEAGYIVLSKAATAQREARIRELQDRLQFDPGGSDKIDELEDACKHLRHHLEVAEGTAEVLRRYTRDLEASKRRDVDTEELSRRVAHTCLRVVERTAEPYLLSHHYNSLIAELSVQLNDALAEVIIPYEDPEHMRSDSWEPGE